MEINKNEIIHDINNLTVKIKSIFSLIISEEDCGIGKEMMISDGDKTIQDIIKLWEEIKRDQK